MRRRTRNLLVLPIVAALILFADQASKRFVIARLVEGESRDIIPWLASIVHVTHVTNTGAAFGLFPNWGDFFVVVAALVIVLLVLYYLQMSDGQWLVQIALALQLGGALGNLIDRLRRGFVVDFIDLNFWPLREWPVFNLADSSIVVGVIMLVLLMMWEDWRKEHKRAKQRTVEDG